MLATVYRPAFSRTERHLCRLAASGADGIVHLAFAKAIVPAGAAAAFAAMLLEAIAAIHRPAARGLERHLRWLTAVRAGCVKHGTRREILVQVNSPPFVKRSRLAFTPADDDPLRILMLRPRGNLFAGLYPSAMRNVSLCAHHYALHFKSQAGEQKFPLFRLSVLLLRAASPFIL